MEVRRLFAPFKPPRTLAGVSEITRRAGPLLRENSMLTSSGYLMDIAADFDILLFELCRDKPTRNFRRLRRVT